MILFVHLDGTKKKYYPSDIKGYGYSIYKFESSYSSFYKIVQTGMKVNQYMNISVNSWSTPGSPGISSMNYSLTSGDFYMRQTNDYFFKLVRKKKFKEEFSKYVEDCDGVSSEILNGNLTHKDIKTIVGKYYFCK